MNTLLGAGIACVAAAIIGGGLKAFGMEIPALNSIVRQLLLAAFGVFLALIGWAQRERPAIVHVPSITSSAPTTTAVPEPATPSGFDYTSQFEMDRTDEARLAQDGESAFGRGDYAWAIRFLAQARQVENAGVWQSSFPFLYGAQLALGKTSDAAITRKQMTQAVKTSTVTGNGYLSNRTPVGFLLRNLGVIRRALPPEHHRDIDSLIQEITVYQTMARP